MVLISVICTVASLRVHFNWSVCVKERTDLKSLQKRCPLKASPETCTQYAIWQGVDALTLAADHSLVGWSHNLSMVSFSFLEVICTKGHSTWQSWPCWRIMHIYDNSETCFFIMECFLILTCCFQKQSKFCFCAVYICLFGIQSCSGKQPGFPNTLGTQNISSLVQIVIPPLINYWILYTLISSVIDQR